MSAVTSFSENLTFSRNLIQYGHDHVNEPLGLHSVIYQVLGRIGFAANIPLEVLACPFDAAYGFTASALSFLTLGTKKALYVKARVHLHSFGSVLTHIFTLTLLVINPHARQISKGTSLVGTLKDQQYLNVDGRAFRYINNKDSFVDRQVKSRFLYVVSLIVTVIARVIHFVIGIIALPFALIAAPFVSLAPEKIGRLTGVALNGLKIFCLFDDVYSHLIHIINPYAGFKYDIASKNYYPIPIPN